MVMKITEIRDKSLDELQVELLNLKKNALNLRFQKSSGQLEKMGQIKETRRQIARVKTIMTEKAEIKN